MRIAFITFEYPPVIIGGAGVYADNVTKELAKLGHQVIVFTPLVVPETPNHIDNLKIINIKVNNKLPFKALQFWLNLPQEIKKTEENGDKFDIIHFNGISYWFLKKKLSKAPHIVTIHHLVSDAIKNSSSSLISRILRISGETSIFIPSIEKRCIMCADKIIAVSYFTKQQIISNYNVTSNKIVVIHNGIDHSCRNFTSDELKGAKKNLNLENRQIALFVGRVDDPRKGLDLLLRAFKHVLGKADVTLLVVGNGDQTNMKELAKALDISKNVVFTGYVNDDILKKYYALCDVYVCPTKLEGFGLTIIEAMAAGKPIVATNVGAIPELLKNNENGILVEPGNIQEMAEAIIKFISDAKYSHQVGEVNKKRLTDEFKWNDNAKYMESLFRGLIDFI